MNKKSWSSVENYYLFLQEQGINIYDIWEDGKAYKDSVTPTTYDLKYREFIKKKIESGVRYDCTKKILSVGSGNAFVESDLQQQGYLVTANDVNKDAIEIAKKKGLPVVWADVKEWEPQQKDFALIYCDGVVGHLYSPSEGLKKIFSRLREWLIPSYGNILISNDAAVIDVPVHPHPDVQGFYWFSADYLRSELLDAGFQSVECESFIYTRPLSGEKKRLILQARA